ncbi:MAG: hypothetical protein IV092_02490 [Burkholderiaceae bacterium]|nr:hypothetical protein [Burkholderiaceae bacterium]
MSNQNTPGGMLKEGLADALGFVVGALAGWQLGVLLGFDFVGTPGYGVPQIIGLVLIVVGCGLGRFVARWLLSVKK